MNEISAANSVLEINPNKEKDPRDMYLGIYTKILLTKLLEQGDMSQRDFDEGDAKYSWMDVISGYVSKIKTYFGRLQFHLLFQQSWF